MTCKSCTISQFLYRNKKPIQDDSAMKENISQSKYSLGYRSVYLLVAIVMASELSRKL
jgi:hypothetical protein